MADVALKPEKNKILIVSRYGELCPMAPRLGANLMFTNGWYKTRGVYEGLAPIVKGIREALSLYSPSLIVFDHTGDQHEQTGKLADKLRAKGIKVWNGSEIQDLLETNRGFGIKVMQDAGIRIPFTVVFDPRGTASPETIDPDAGGNARLHRARGHLAEAIGFVKKHDARWVLKPFDTVASDLTYVSENAEDMEARLRHAGEAGELDDSQPFMLQEFIKGIEISTEIIVGQGQVLLPPNATLETKKVFAGDLGPNTGCATSVVWNYPNIHTRIQEETMGRPEFLAFLRQPTMGKRTFLPYNGCLDLNCIISERDRKPYGIEWTPRFGYSAFYGWLQLVQGDVGETWKQIADGVEPTLSCGDGYGYSLRVSIPPGFSSDRYVPPTGDTPSELRDNWAFAERFMEPATGIDIEGPIDDPHVYLLDAMKYKDRIVTAGADTSIMEIAARGDTLEEAKKTVHGLFEKIKLQDKYARTEDGTKRAEEDLKTLEKWGYEVPNEVPKASG